jgi:hypothetical protein
MRYSVTNSTFMFIVIVVVMVMVMVILIVICGLHYCRHLEFSFVLSSFVIISLTLVKKIDGPPKLNFEKMHPGNFNTVTRSLTKQLRTLTVKNQRFQIY